MASSMKAQWQAQTKVLDTIKDLFDGWEDAIVELVKNAIDADADEIRIHCTEGPQTKDEKPFLSVSDNGCGMSQEDVIRKYMVIGRDKRIDDGAVSPAGRPYLGKRGTGKIASTNVAKRIIVETVKSHTRTTFQYSAESIRESSLGKSTDLLVEDTHEAKTGTTITLSRPQQTQAFWNLESQAKTVLLRDFSQISGVRFIVNDKQFEATDLATSADRFDEDVPGCGRVEGEIWVAKSKLSAPGLVLYHEGQKVGEPSMFGLSKTAGQKEVRTVTGRILGRVDVYPTDGFTSPGNWKLTSSYKALEAWLADRIQCVVSKETQEHLRNRVERWLKDHRVKKYWMALNDSEKAETRAILMRRALVAKDDKAETIIAGLIARAMKSRGLMALLNAIDDADDQTLDTFAEILDGEDPWELRQVAVAATIVKERIRTLAQLKAVTATPDFNENQAHQILEENPWIIADDFLSYRSNNTLRAALKDLGIILKSKDGSTRPDMLFVLGNEDTEMTTPAVGAMRYLFVELKGPDQPLGVKQQNQATNYASKFLKHMGAGFAHVWLIGSEFDPNEPAEKFLGAEGRFAYRAMTYVDLIAVAERRLTYVNDAKATRVDVLAKKVLAIEAASLTELTVGKLKTQAEPAAVGITTQ